MNIIYFFFIKIGKSQIIEYLERENQNIISHYDQIIRKGEIKLQACEAKLLKVCDERGKSCCVCYNGPATHAPKNCGHCAHCIEECRKITQQCGFNDKNNGLY